VTKDPDARLDYAFDWRGDDPWLEEDETIESYTFEVVQGDVEVDADAELNGVVTAWLIGGTPGVKSKLTCHIVTDVGREDDRTMTITIKER
jgi:hypothetical protein